MIKEIPDINMLFSYDWRAKLLVRLSNTGVWDVEELVEKAKQLEQYFFNGEHADYVPTSPEDHLITVYKIRMVGIHLRSGCNDVDEIIKVVDNSKDYLLNHILDKVKGKSFSDINELFIEFQKQRITSNSIMLP